MNETSGADQRDELHGFCDDRFRRVQRRFLANFAAGDELGASVAVAVDGELVADLWAGDRDLAGNPWEADTIVNVYSTTKTMTALCVLLLVGAACSTWMRRWPPIGPSSP